MEAKIFQPIETVFRKATSFAATSVLQAGEKHGFFNRLGSRGEEARLWLLAKAGLDKKSLATSVQADIELLRDDSAHGATSLEGPQASSQPSAETTK